MKVLEIISAGYVAGGAENTVIKIKPYLLDKGYIVKILASDLGSDKKHFNDYTFKSISRTGPLKPLFFTFNPSSFFTLKNVLKEYKPDIIHLHTMDQITPSVLFLLKKYPTVMTLHGPESFLSKLLIWFMQPGNFKHHVYDKKDLNIVGKFTYLYFNSIQKVFYKFALMNVDIFIAPSKYIEKVAKADALSPIIHLPNFIELQQFHELTNNHTLLFVGRLEKMKGVEFVIQALPSIIKVFPQAKLVIVGDGPHKADLFNLTKKLQLEEYVHFKGWVENKDINTYYKNTSIVVVPSTCTEGFGIVNLEAMSAGRPVIGTNVGGIPEIVDDGVNGYIIEPENPEQIAERVIKLFSDDELLKYFGINARKKSESFNIEKHVEELDKVYKYIKMKYIY